MKQCPQCKLKYPSESVTCFVDGTSLVDIPDPRIGTTLAGRYVIENVIGEGGMATVYRAQHKLVDRPCAVKIMNAALAKNEVIRERFRREAKAAQTLAHPNIIEIFDQGETQDGSMYLVMELLDGESLADVVERGKVPLERALPIWIQISRALARAHDFEVIHRDLKPENIFLQRLRSGGETVKLLDFGIARSMQDSRLTGAGEVFGTPQYMAPERITSIDAGPAADLYAVGVIMYEMLVGELPFDAPDVATFFIKHLKEAAPHPKSKDPTVPEQLDALVVELMAKAAKDRPVDAHKVHKDLLALAGAIGIRVPAEVPQDQPSSREPAPTLPPVAIDRWAKRTVLFEQMLQKVYGAQPPTEQAGLLREVKELVREIAVLRGKAVQAQRKLEAVETRGRDGRQRFGNAVDALGIDASKARNDAKEEEARCDAARERFASAREAFVATHQEIVRWEGRSGFQEPYADLAKAYRGGAAAVEAWLVVRDELRACERVATEKKGFVADLDFQIQALRLALQNHEQEIEKEQSECETQVGNLGGKAEELEGQLLALATRFCAPLRSRPELGPLFQELEADAAA